jgi:hypothetical protein
MNRFFKYKNAPIFGEPRHQMLRPLEYKIPSKMGKTDQRVAAAMSESRRRDDRGRHAGRRHIG